MGPIVLYTHAKNWEDQSRFGEKAKKHLHKKSMAQQICLTPVMAFNMHLITFLELELAPK